MELQTRRAWAKSDNNLITDNVEVGQELQVLHAFFKGSRTLEAVRTQARKLGYGAKTINGTIVMKATVNSNLGKQNQKIVDTTASIETAIARVEGSGAARTVQEPTISTENSSKKAVQSIANQRFNSTHKASVSNAIVTANEKAIQIISRYDIKATSKDIKSLTDLILGAESL